MIKQREASPPVNAVKRRRVPKFGHTAKCGLAGFF